MWAFIRKIFRRTQTQLGSGHAFSNCPIVVYPAKTGELWRGADTLAIPSQYPIKKRLKHVAAPSAGDLDCFGQSLAFMPTQLSEVGEFLQGCRYESDPSQHQKQEHWMHPTEFEKTRAGDCEDHAIWAWRCLHSAGYHVRLAIGLWGSGGHAWVFLYEHEKCYILETTNKLPNSNHISPDDYVPDISFERNADEEIKMYLHQQEWIDFVETLPKKKEITCQQWETIDALIFTGAKNDALQVINDIMGPNGNATRMFLDRYALLRKEKPRHFELSDTSYWDDWR